MTDKAFSDLTSASALNDADIFAITQSGTSKKIASSVVKTYMQEGFTPTSTTTLTNKTVNLTNNTLTGTIAQFNSALSDADFCTIAGSETITNKTLTTPILSATVSGTTSGRLGYLSGALSYGDGTNQQTVATLDRTQTFTAAQSFSGNVTLGDASGDTVTLNSGTVTLNNSTTISAASTKTLTLNGGAGSNGLVLDASNNVGIGYNTPGAYRVYVKSTDTAVWAANTSQSQILSYNAGVANNSCSTMEYQVTYGDSTSGGVKIGAVASASYSGDFVIANRNNGTYQENLRLTYSGNLGLGVTPNTWYSGYTALEFKNYGAITSRAAANSMEILTNAYRNASANYVYKQTGAAQILEMANGAYNFYIASSGTAGATFTPTQAMTLDASGNLGIGTSSPASPYRLSITGNGSSVVGGLALTSNGNTAYIGQTGATSADCEYWNAANGYVRIGTNNTERARITAAGDLLVGNTSATGSGKINMYFASGSNGFSAVSTDNTTNASFMQMYANSSFCGNITRNGTSNAVLYNTSSDQRLKTNVTPAGSAIQSILDFPVDQFDWIESGEHQDFGAVAQKAVNFIPEMVNAPADPEAIWGLDWSKAVPRLIKTIQELSAEIETLKQKVNV